jgi:hypothetical protein
LRSCALGCGWLLEGVAQLPERLFLALQRQTVALLQVQSPRPVHGWDPAVPCPSAEATQATPAPTPSDPSGPGGPGSGPFPALPVGPSLRWTTLFTRDGLPVTLPTKASTAVARPVHRNAEAVSLATTSTRSRTASSASRTHAAQVSRTGTVTASRANTAPLGLTSTRSPVPATRTGTRSHPAASLQSATASASATPATRPVDGDRDGVGDRWRATRVRAHTRVRRGFNCSLRGYGCTMWPTMCAH